MKRSLLAFSIVILLILLLFNSCSTGSSSSNSTSGTSNGIVTYQNTGTPQDNVKILDSQTLDNAQYNQDGTIEINENTDIKEGDIIASAPSKIAPYGFLKKVIGVKKLKDGTTQLQTQPAALTEAFKEAHLKTKFNLTPSNSSFTPSLRYKKLKVTKGSDDSFSLEFNDLELNIKGKTIYVDLQLTVNPDVDINIDIDNQGSWYDPDPVLSEFKVVSHVVTTESITFHNEFELGSFEKSWKLGEFSPASPITIMVGPVPIVFTPKVEIYLTASGEVTVGFEITPSLTQDIKAGLHYYNGSWHTIHNFNGSFDCNASLQAQASVQVGLGPRLVVLLYGIVGPYVDITPYLELSATASTNNPTAIIFSLYGGIEASGGVEVEVLSKKIADYESPAIINYQHLIRQWVLDFSLDAPSNFSANLINNDSVHLTWTDNSIFEKGFRIERRIGDGNYQFLANVAKDSTEYTDILGQNTYGNITYRIRAYNDNSTSDWVSVSINIENPNPPNAPTNFQANWQGAGMGYSILTWTDNSDNEQGFVIERKGPGDATYTVIRQEPKNVTTSYDDNIHQNGTYYYRIKAYNANGESNYIYTQMTVSDL